MVDFSIAICTYNKAQYLPHALETALAQEYPPERYEIIVVDNNSTDGTRQVIEKYMGRFANYVPVQETQPGLSHARNRALKEARGAFVVFIDDDCEIAPAYLQHLQQAVAEVERVGVLGGPVGVKWVTRRPRWWTNGLDAVFNRTELAPERRILEDGRKLVGTNFTVRRDLVQSVGLFDVDLGRKGSGLMASEEVEYVTRVQKAGYRVVYEPGCRVDHLAIPERARVGYILRRSWNHGRSYVLMYRAQRTYWQHFHVILASLKRRVIQFHVRIFYSVEAWNRLASQAGAFYQLLCEMASGRKGTRE